MDANKRLDITPTSDFASPQQKVNIPVQSNFVYAILYREAAMPLGIGAKVSNTLANSTNRRRSTDDNVWRAV